MWFDLLKRFEYLNILSVADSKAHTTVPSLLPIGLGERIGKKVKLLCWDWYSWLGQKMKGI